MPANRLNYIVLFEDTSQVYGSSSREVAMKSDPIDGYEIEDKQVFYITHDPDSNDLIIKRIPIEESIAEYKDIKQELAAEDEDDDS